MRTHATSHPALQWPFVQAAIQARRGHLIEPPTVGLGTRKARGSLGKCAAPGTPALVLSSGERQGSKRRERKRNGDWTQTRRRSRRTTPRPLLRPLSMPCRRPQAAPRLTAACNFATCSSVTPPTAAPCKSRCCCSRSRSSASAGRASRTLTPKPNGEVAPTGPSLSMYRGQPQRVTLRSTTRASKHKREVGGSVFFAGMPWLESAGPGGPRA